MLDLPEGRWEGLDGLGEAALAELKPRAEAALLRALLYFVGELKITLSGARHGRSYQVSKTGALHVASAPGEPPAVLYGRLRNSIDHTGPEWDGWTVQGTVGTNLPYGRRLEFGGVHVQRLSQAVKGLTGWFTVKAGTVIRVLARPWVEPTVLRITPAIEAMWEAGL